MSKKKTVKKEKPRVNKELEGFDIQINSFGEINTTYDLDKVNEFLNKNVDDKKLRGRDFTQAAKEKEEDTEEDQKE